MARQPRPRGAGAGPALDLDFGDAAPLGEPLPGVAARRARLRVERGVDDSIKAGRGDGGEADPRWRAAEALARKLAHAIDHTQDPYAVAQLGPKLLEVLRELRLTPVTVKAADSLDAILADLRDDGDD